VSSVLACMFVPFFHEVRTPMPEPEPEENAGVFVLDGNSYVRVSTYGH